jgi:hypothetical protein
MNLPDRISIRVDADGKPAAGMFVRVTLQMARKNDFSLGFGPSDIAGRLNISREDLLLEAEKERRLFVMDYGHPERDFGGELSIQPLNREALARAIAAYELYHDETEFPAGYVDMLREASTNLDRNGHRQLSVEVEFADPGVRIQSVTSAA